jgi:hypothetical protein
MRTDRGRREFLKTAGFTPALIAGSSILGASDRDERGDAASDSARYPYALGGAAPAGRPKRKLAALCTVYHYLSHAYHIVGRFIDGFVVHDGRGLHHPDFEIASLFIEQIHDDDLGRAKAKRHGVRLCPTIADALTLGTDKLAVDGVLLIGEHGDYPINEKLQKLYPRGRFLFETLDVFQRSHKSVPVFIDKHLSYNRFEGMKMVARSHTLKAPLMAGSSLPVTYRKPSLEVPLGKKWKEALVASRGEIELFGFHALESLQCMVERRERNGKPQGVIAATCLEGDAVWKAGDAGKWSWELLDRAIARSHSHNPGDIRQNTLDFNASAKHTRLTPNPLAFLVEYADGFRGTVLIVNGHVDDTTIAARVENRPGVDSIVSTLFYLPAPPGADFFSPLVLRIEDFLATGKSPYPVERTMLTGGILDAAIQSRFEGYKRIETPELAAIDYPPPADSGYFRGPVADERPNEG